MVSLLYILIIWSYSAILDEPTSQTNALAAAADVALGEIGALMIVLAASFSIMANGFTGLIVSPPHGHMVCQSKECCQNGLQKSILHS